MSNAVSICREYRNVGGVFSSLAELLLLKDGSVSWGDYDNEGLYPYQEEDSS